MAALAATVILQDADADEDPYSYYVPRKDSDEPPVPRCNGEEVMHECWCSKRSQWLRQWRWRWLVVTSTTISFFERKRGYQCGDNPTEIIELDSFVCGAFRVLDDVAVKLEQPPLPPHACCGSLIKLCSTKREVLIDLSTGSPDDSPPRAGQSHADDHRVWACVTAMVNARCALRTDLSTYRVPGTMHVFEPPGAASMHERYALGQELGRGAFGIVYRARCAQSGRSVAVKTIRTAMLAHRQRVREEVRLMQLVQHAHVISLVNCHETLLTAHLVLELLPGGDLFSQVVERYCGREAVGYAEWHVREIMRMALSGVAALHAHRIVHRDLKPENVLLVDRRGGLLDLRIADLGAATQLASADALVTSMAGSKGYMAPEVVCELPYGLPADLWSIGVLLFTLLSGRHPFADPFATLESADGDEDPYATIHPRGHSTVDAAPRHPYSQHVPRPPAARCSFRDANWESVSAEAKDTVRALLCQTPEQRPSAHEALDLPWFRPCDNFTLRSSMLPHDAAAAGRGEGGRAAGGGMARVSSLPGSASLLQLSKLGALQRERQRVAPPAHFLNANAKRPLAPEECLDADAATPPPPSAPPRLASSRASGLGPCQSAGQLDLLSPAGLASALSPGSALVAMMDDAEEEATSPEMQGDVSETPPTSEVVEEAW